LGKIVLNKHFEKAVSTCVVTEMSRFVCKLQTIGRDVFFESGKSH